MEINTTAIQAPYFLSPLGINLNWHVWEKADIFSKAQKPLKIYVWNNTDSK